MSEPLADSSRTRLVRRRPLDRREQVIIAARALLTERGYRNVSMADIAERVGITAGALYRHFSNKAVLLAAVIDASIDQTLSQIDRNEGQFDSMLHEACEAAVSSPDLGVLWWRESRHLDASTATRIRQRLAKTTARFQRHLLAERPSLSSHHAQRLTWGLEAVIASPTFHSTNLQDQSLVALLVSASTAIRNTDLASPPRTRRIESHGLTPVSMRERLLNHAAMLFATNGFEETTLDDIGAAAGMTGPNLYSYFDSKAAIYDAANQRASSALWLGLNRALRATSDPSRALKSVVNDYTANVLERTVVISAVISDRQDFKQLRRAQHEYVDEWVALLLAARPNYGEPDARALVHTALAVINHISTWYAHGDVGIADDIVAMAIAVLFDS